MLNEYDHELERRRHRFVRYADDLTNLLQEQESSRTQAHILPYIEGKLLLRVNREKTQVAYVNKVKYLGYSFYISRGKGRLRVHPKASKNSRTKSEK